VLRRTGVTMRVKTSQRLSGNFSLRRRKLMPPPYGNETQGDHQAQVGLA
jgi:hypothetical protein